MFFLVRLLNRFFYVPRQWQELTTSHFHTDKKGEFDCDPYAILKEIKAMDCFRTAITKPLEV